MGPALGEPAPHAHLPRGQGPKGRHWGRSEQPELASVGATPNAGAAGQWAWTSCSRDPCHSCAPLPFLGMSCSCRSPQAARAPSLMAQGVPGRRAGSETSRMPGRRGRRGWKQLQAPLPHLARRLLCPAPSSFWVATASTWECDPDGHSQDDSRAVAAQRRTPAPVSGGFFKPVEPEQLLHGGLGLRPNGAAPRFLYPHLPFRASQLQGAYMMTAESKGCQRPLWERSEAGAESRAGQALGERAGEVPDPAPRAPEPSHTTTNFCSFSKKNVQIS